jgi:F-type H+-transporting ATPase subunit epsilon
MAKLLAQLISPDRIVIDGEVQSITLPGIDGDMTVSLGRQRVVTLLRAGIVTAVDPAGRAQRAYERGAFAEITDRTVTILAEQALPVEERSLPLVEDEISQLRMRAKTGGGELLGSWLRLSIAALEDLKTSLRG